MVLIAAGLLCSRQGVARAIDAPAGENVFTAPIPPGGHANIFQLDTAQLEDANRRGRRALLQYVATDTTIAGPYDPMSRLYRRLDHRRLLRRAVQRNGLSDIGHGWTDTYASAGLVPYPQTEDAGAYFVPFPEAGRPTTPMGFTVFADAHHTRRFTLSCAACHTRNLFGRPVLGGTNLVGGAGDTLLLLKKVSRLPDRKYRFATHADQNELAAFRSLKHQAHSVQGKPSRAPGLENPVAFVGQALERQTPNVSAPTSTYQTETKPPVLWNLKYKNRFQHDGSMRGNPLLANLIFNEVGRGANLAELERWIAQKRDVIDDLTAAAYAMTAPRWTDFFPAASIDIAQARRGEHVFEQRCAHCHGMYEKAWHATDVATLAEPARAGLLETVRVTMPTETISRDVGTDRLRSEAMVGLASRANRLSVFRKNDISFTSNPGQYVPPPLVGVWARWPYLHNNSVASLDQLLTPAKDRATTFYVGPADDAERDYDAHAVGFPLGDDTPRNWRRPSRLFDTRLPGLSNSGHDEGIFATDGVSDLADTERRDLIEFLKTL
jgi:mono/diheme cytochrome c family protein